MNPPLYTNQSEKKGIVLNRMYTGSYLSSNLGHEVINMFPDDDGSHYMYLNATGDFSAEHVGKIGSMLLIKYAGQDEDGRPWVEVLGCATGLKDVYNPNRVPQNKETSLFSDDKSKNFEGVKYGGVPIHDVFGDAAQQKVFISYYAEKLLVPKEDIKIFLRFAPFNNRTEASIKFAYSDKPDVEPDSSTYQSIIPNIESESYLWKQTSDDEAVPLYTSKVYVVEMETKFASTSLKRYFIYKKAVGTDADKITKANKDLDKIDHLISCNRLWRPSPELPLIEKVNLNNEDVENDEVSNNNDVSIFDICRIENNENCFSNALAHFMDKYRAQWCEFFKTDLKIDLDENFEIFREIDATIPKNNNDETDNSDGRNKKGGRIDLLLKDNENIIIIENKIKSDINGVKSDGDGQQLKRYQDYAHWLKYQHELDTIKNELKEKYVNSTYFDVQVDAEGKVSITTKSGNKKFKEPYLRDNKVEEQGTAKWKEYNVRKLSALKVHLFILYPNYNIPHIPKECKEEWGHITYQNISDMLNKYFPLSRDSNLMDFFNAMQRHKYKNLCDWMRVDMRKQFIARIK